MLRKVLATFGVAALLGACGSPPPTGGPPEATDAIALAADRMRDAGSMRFTMDITTTGEGFSMDMAGQGAVDMTARTMIMEMETSGLPGMEGDGRVEMRMVGDYAYMKLPLGNAGLPPGKSWVRFDVATMGGGLGDPFSSNDPTAMADFLRGVSGDVETIGREDVRGHATTHYRADIDLEKALDKMPAEQRANAAAAIENLKTAKVTTMPMEVWIDDEGLIWRQFFEVAFGEQGSMLMMFEVLEYGVEVDGEKPPADEVFDSPQLGTGSP